MNYFHNLYISSLSSIRQSRRLDPLFMSEIVTADGYLYC